MELAPEVMSENDRDAAERGREGGEVAALAEQASRR